MKNSTLRTGRRPAPWRRAAFFLAITLGFALAPAAWANDKAEVAQRLEEVRKEIAALRDRLEAAQGERGRIEAALRKADREIADADRQLAATERAMEQAGARLAELEAEQAQERERLESQLALLARQLRAAYLAGRQDRLALLLNQEDPATVGRLLVYYRHYNDARGERIREVDEALENLALITREVSEAREQLAGERHRRQQLRDRLAEGQEERRRLLARLEAEIEATGTGLSRLEEDEEGMEELLRSLDRALQDIPEHSQLDEPFADRRGKLPWPTEGPLRARFGTPRGGQSGLQWRGVVIGAEPGDPVHAIHHGRVVFSDWMRGFGLLTIIDHGHGYMTLYGHNQSLYRSPGDWVQAGDLIARVGEGPGEDGRGLYFEIRHQGNPLNPGRWCDSNVKIAAPASHR
nr:peptidoglycan DD-metalloendopeptidase family protein [Thioalkalivibrio denitrificans]